MKLFEFEHGDQYSLVTEHDFRGLDFVYYSAPISHYDIQEWYARIASFDQLEYIAEIFFFLNPDVDLSIFQGIFRWVGNRENGRTVRTYGKARIDQMIESVYRERKKPWCRRMRRIIFNPEKIISASEKMSITAQVVGRGISYTEHDVRQMIEYMYRDRIVATYESIGKRMGCSSRTIQRLMKHDLRQVMKLNNEHVKREIKIEKAIEWIDVLSSEGDGLKMRILKDMTKIRDYSILKEALYRYETDC